MKKALVVGLVLAGLLNVVPAFAEDNIYTIVRSQDLIGKQVKNEAGAVLGKVEDYVINIKDGSVVYAVLQNGDTLGFGGKLFAIPPQAMMLSKDLKNVVLNVDKDELDKATGFDANKWPSEPDARWGKGKASSTPDRKDEPKKEGNKDEDKIAHLRRVSSLMGTTMKNEKGEDLGSMQGVVFDFKDKNGKVLYAALAYGGVAGVGSKYFAVPWEALKYEAPTLKAGEHAFVINVDKSDLENAKGFDTKSWPTKPDTMFTKNNKTPDKKP